MLLFSFSAPACFLLAQMIPFNPEEILWAPVQLFYLRLLYLMLALPFFFAANVIGLSFYHQDPVSSIYAADLLGAGAGSIGIILLLFLLFPEKILTVWLNRSSRHPDRVALQLSGTAGRYKVPDQCRHYYWLGGDVCADRLAQAECFAL